MWKQIGKTVLLAGIADLTAACIQAYLTSGVLPGRVMEFIASGLLGNKAFSGSVWPILLGAACHFLIIFCCVFTFFLLYPRLRFLQKSILLNSLLIGIIAWSVTVLLVIPASRITPGPLEAGRVFISILILIGCVGLPTSVMAKKFFKIPHPAQQADQMFQLN